MSSTATLTKPNTLNTGFAGCERYMHASAVEHD